MSRDFGKNYLLNTRNRGINYEGVIYLVENNVIQAHAVNLWNLFAFSLKTLADKKNEVSGWHKDLLKAQFHREFQMQQVGV